MRNLLSTSKFYQVPATESIKYSTERTIPVVETSKVSMERSKGTVERTKVSPERGKVKTETCKIIVTRSILSTELNKGRIHWGYEFFPGEYASFYVMILMVLGGKARHF